LTVGAILISVCVGLVAQKINGPEGITGQSLLSLVISSQMCTLKQWQDQGALPGHSEHQLGTTIDLTVESIALTLSEQ
jgi:LAS superfamily LD-carboxypeptidase LdcB